MSREGEQGVRILEMFGGHSPLRPNFVPLMVRPKCASLGRSVPLWRSKVKPTMMDTVVRGSAVDGGDVTFP